LTLIVATGTSAGSHLPSWSQGALVLNSFGNRSQFVLYWVVLMTLKGLYCFYLDGFRSMVVGRTLWKLLAIKLFFIFAVLKLFFFSNYLAANFPTDRARANSVLGNLARLPSSK
jgi:hypothetical protein